jgi:hypothetical protein
VASLQYFRSWLSAESWRVPSEPSASVTEALTGYQNLVLKTTETVLPRSGGHGLTQASGNKIRMGDPILPPPALGGSSIPWPVAIVFVPVATWLLPACLSQVSLRPLIRTLAILLGHLNSPFLIPPAKSSYMQGKDHGFRGSGHIWGYFSAYLCQLLSRQGKSWCLPRGSRELGMRCPADSRSGATPVAAALRLPSWLSHHGSEECGGPDLSSRGSNSNKDPVARLVL